jgi:aspartyl-tRNA(Asn)/glutamyl-tRNA(Gln) amidotransferase subunit A
MDRAAEALLAIIQPEASVTHAHLIETEPEKFGPLTRQQIEAGFKVPATAYLQALRQQKALQQRFALLFKEVDALLSPAVPWVAPVEDPALVLPMGLGAAGMPVGLQVVSPWKSEAMLLSLGSALETLIQPEQRAAFEDAAARLR